MVLHFLKRNYGWMIVAVLASLPLFLVLNMTLTEINKDFLTPTIQNTGENSKTNVAMLYHISGEFAIRWMTAVLTLTPFYILFGITNLFVRQAMGIATTIWSFVHFIIFLWAEGFSETFSQLNYIIGLVAVLILIPLILTSNRKSMKLLKSNWKKLQRFVYLAVFLSLLHVAILDKTWLIYAVIVGIGFIIRMPFIKNKCLRKRQKRKRLNS